MLLADADEFHQTGEAYDRLLLEQRVDGLLIGSASTEDPFPNDLLSRSLPFVLVKLRQVPRVGPCVRVDDERVDWTCARASRRTGPPTHCSHRWSPKRRHGTAAACGISCWSACGGLAYSGHVHRRSALRGGGGEERDVSPSKSSNPPDGGNRLESGGDNWSVVGCQHPGRHHSR